MKENIVDNYLNYLNEGILKKIPKFLNKDVKDVFKFGKKSKEIPRLKNTTKKLTDVEKIENKLKDMREKLKKSVGDEEAKKYYKRQLLIYKKAYAASDKSTAIKKVNDAKINKKFIMDKHKRMKQQQLDAIRKSKGK